MSTDNSLDGGFYGRLAAKAVTERDEAIPQLEAERAKVVRERIGVLGEVIDLINDCDDDMSFVLLRVESKLYSALADLKAMVTTT